MLIISKTHLVTLQYKEKTLDLLASDSSVSAFLGDAAYEKILQNSRQFFNEMEHNKADC
jgi:hypothetical protein